MHVKNDVIYAVKKCSYGKIESRCLLWFLRITKTSEGKNPAQGEQLLHKIIQDLAFESCMFISDQMKVLRKS